MPWPSVDHPLLTKSTRCVCVIDESVMYKSLYDKEKREMFKQFLQNSAIYGCFM